jgi:hypothetical protein
MLGTASGNDDPHEGSVVCKTVPCLSPSADRASIERDPWYDDRKGEPT